MVTFQFARVSPGNCQPTAAGWPATTDNPDKHGKAHPFWNVGSWSTVRTKEGGAG